MDWDWTLDFIERQAGRRPQATAITDTTSGRAYSYGELAQRGRVAASLLADDLGLAKGDRVAVLSRNRVEYFDLFFSTPKTGVVLVPLNTRLTPVELAYQVKLTGACVLVYENELQDLAAGLMDQISFDRTVSLGAGGEYEGLMRDGLAWEEGENPSPAEGWTEDRAERWQTGTADLSLDDPCLILFTGGTTGPPKGAVISHRAILFNMISEVVSWELTSDWVAPNLLPLFHTGGWNLVTLPLLYAGGRVLISRGFDPEETLRLVEEEKCDLLFAAATMFQMMIDSPSFAGADLSSLRFAMSGAAPCPKSVMEAFWAKGVKFCQGYGCTEGGPNNLFVPWQDLSLEELEGKWASVGVPFLYCNARIVDPSGREVPPGELGELILAGPEIFSGYHDNPEETANTLRDGWVWTGDIARQDPEGYVYIVDRRKDMFISGGENVYPSEVEALINQHPKVVECAVIGVPDDKWGEVGKAFVVSEEALTVEDLSGFLQDGLAKYKIPKHIEFVDALLKSGVGKILKKELRRQK